MFRNITILSIVFLLFGCIGRQQHYTRYKGSTIERTGTLVMTELPPCKVDYTSYKQLLKNLDEDRTLYSMGDEQYLRKKKNLDKGGKMSIAVYSNTIGSCNPMYWFFNITDKNGKEVFKGKGDDRIGSGTVVGSGQYISTYWTGYQFFHFQEEFDGDYFDLKVIDTFSKKVATFRIHIDKIIETPNPYTNLQ